MDRIGGPIKGGYNLDFIDVKGSKPGNNLMLVDSLNLAFRYKYANKKEFAQEYINTIASLGVSYDAKDIIILGDGGSTYREAIYPKYKANRKELKEKQTEKEAQDFKNFLNEYINTFNQLSELYYTFRFKGVEADDLAAYFACNYANEYDHIWLISSDKDWDLLVNDKVSRFSFVTRKEITIDNWDTHYDYAPEHHISIKVLQGDKGDNIDGVAGIGIKRAISLVDKYGDAIEIFSQLPISSNYKYIQNLNAFGDNILLNYKLMDLSMYYQEAIGENILKELKENFKNG